MGKGLSGVIDPVLIAVSTVTLLVVVATLVVALLTLRSSRRSEEMGEDRVELLRDQQGRLELLREERQLLTEELERERRKRLESEQKASQLELEQKQRLLPAVSPIQRTKPLQRRSSWWRRLWHR